MLGVEFLGDDYICQHHLGHREGACEELECDESLSVRRERSCSGQHRVRDDGEEEHPATSKSIGDDPEEKGGQGAKPDNCSEFPQLFFGNQKLGLNLLESEAE